MNFSNNLKMYALSMLCSAALVACGGGGGTTTATDPATSDTTDTTTEFNVAEYVGTWKVDAPVCNSGFPYGNYWYALTELSFTEKEVATTHLVYDDAACTSKAGRVKEMFDATWTAGSVSGKTNVAKLKLAYTGMSSGADGGTGFSMTKIPDGSLIGSSKQLFDVDAGKLFGSTGTSIDADGYPTALQTSGFATQQP